MLGTRGSARSRSSSTRSRTAREWEICVGGALLGVGIGFAFASMANLVVESVPRDEVGVATGINTIMRSLGGALGAQLVATLLTGKTIAGSAIPAEAAYTDAFIVAAVAAGAGDGRRAGDPAQAARVAAAPVPVTAASTASSRSSSRRCSRAQWREELGSCA